ncbi:MAG: preprotein translocase subunit SecE [Rickettsiales bacterium]|jgi:preprotein translocase subunit SecE|nr:preprotein translocase subunit SecE [Rickettsiales bacterium]
MNIIKFIEEVREETSKISWPKRESAMQAVVMVVIFATIISLFFFGVDQFFGFIMQLLFKR